MDRLDITQWVQPSPPALAARVGWLFVGGVLALLGLGGVWSWWQT